MEGDELRQFTEEFRSIHTKGTVAIADSYQALMIAASSMAEAYATLNENMIAIMKSDDIPERDRVKCMSQLDRLHEKYDVVDATLVSTINEIEEFMYGKKSTD